MENILNELKDQVVHYDDQRKIEVNGKKMVFWTKGTGLIFEKEDVVKFINDNVKENLKEVAKENGNDATLGSIIRQIVNE